MNKQGIRKIKTNENNEKKKKKMKAQKPGPEKKYLESTILVNVCKGDFIFSIVCMK